MSWVAFLQPAKALNRFSEILITDTLLTCVYMHPLSRLVFATCASLASS